MISIQPAAYPRALQERASDRRMPLQGPLQVIRGFLGWAFPGGDMRAIADAGGWAVQLIENYDAYMENQRGPNARAVLRTAQKIGKDFLPLDRFCRYKAGMAIVKITGRAVPIAEAIVVVGYRVYFDYPKIRAACLMENAAWLCSLGRHQEARDLLAQAQNWGVGDTRAVQLYAGCIDFLEALPDLVANKASGERLGQLVPNVQLAINTFKNQDPYIDLRNDLLYLQAIACLRTEGYCETMEVLHPEGVASSVRERVLVFLVDRAESLAKEDLDAAESYLLKADGVVPTLAYNTIVTKYREYISCRKREPILTPASDQGEIAARVGAIDGVLELLEPTEPLAPLRKSLRSDKLFIYINTRKHEDANALLKEMDFKVRTRVAFYLIEQAENLCAKGKREEAVELLREAEVSLDLLKPKTWKETILYQKPDPGLKNLLRRYRDYINERPAQVIVGRPEAII